MIRCRAARHLVEVALERELALEQRLELEAHVARCPACAGHEQRARALQELLEGPGDPHPTAPDVEAAARAVFAALERGEGRAWRPRRARRAVLVGAVALASIAGAALCFGRLRYERAEPASAALALAALSPPDEPGWTAAGVEASVRAALLASFGTRGADEVRALQRYLEGTRAPARAGWPVRRFVEGLLESPDVVAALAAARCLGTLGEISAAPALERALARAELADEALDALGTLASLGELEAQSEPAVAVLERALGDQELAPRALLQLCRVGGARAARAIERAARAARESSIPSREALLDALTATGPAAVESLLRLAAEQVERARSTAILARLPLVARAGPELVHVLTRARFPGDLAYRALLLLQPPEALAWLEERCGSHRERALALETLASFPGSGPLASALRLAEGGRVPREDVLALLAELLERDSERGAALTRALVEQGEAATLQGWLALLIEGAHPGAARALVPLVFCVALADDDRQWAALAVGELGGPADGERLLRALGEHVGDDRRRTAACLLSIYALLGTQGVERLLTSCSTSNVRRVLAALDSQGRSGEAVLVHRVARALDGALADVQANANKSDNKREVL